jgi:hypothetical protein
VTQAQASTPTGQSPIFDKTQQLLAWLLPHTNKFPHAEKFRMKQRVEDAAFGFHEMLLRSVGGPANARRYLPEAEVRLNQLRLYLRLCMELKLTSFDQYEHAARLLTEIGKLLGAWIKKTASPSAVSP